MARKAQAQDDFQVEEFYTVRFKDREFLNFLNTSKQDVRSCTALDEMKRYSTEARAALAIDRILGFAPDEAGMVVVFVRAYASGRMHVETVSAFDFGKVGKPAKAKKPSKAKKAKGKVGTVERDLAVDPYAGRWANDQFGFLSPVEQD